MDKLQFSSINMCIKSCINRQMYVDRAAALYLCVSTARCGLGTTSLRQTHDL